MKKGRPKKEADQLPIKFTLRLEKDLMNELKKFCDRNNITKAKALKTAISLYIGYIPKQKK